MNLCFWIQALEWVFTIRWTVSSDCEPKQPLLHQVAFCHSKEKRNQDSPNFSEHVK